MKKTKIALCLIILSYLPWSFNSMIAASDDSKIDTKVELWEMEFVKLKELLPQKEWPPKGAVVIAYYPEKNEGIIHFMYEDRTIKINILKENETDYVLKYKDKTLLLYRLEYPKRSWVTFILFSDKNEKLKQLKMKISFQDSDGAYNKKSAEKIDELLERLREQDKFAEEEQEAFEKDPPNMMKGGK